MSNGIKNDQDKPRMDLLSTEALIQISRVMGFGAKKYSAHNWRGGLAWSRLIGAAMRHLTAFNDGQDLDPETGISHLAHAACCLMFLLDYAKSHPELDDRYRQNIEGFMDQNKELMQDLESPQEILKEGVYINLDSAVDKSLHQLVIDHLRRSGAV